MSLVNAFARFVGGTRRFLTTPHEQVAILCEWCGFDSTDREGDMTIIYFPDGNRDRLLIVAPDEEDTVLILAAYSMNLFDPARVPPSVAREMPKRRLKFGEWKLHRTRDSVLFSVEHLLARREANPIPFEEICNYLVKEAQAFDDAVKHLV